MTTNDEVRTAQPAARRGSRWLSASAAVLIVLGLVLAPVALLATWVRGELVDSTKFVSTLAPLASDPAVQQFITDQTMAAIDDNLDVDAVVADVFDGIADLGLSPRAAAALNLLQAPAAAGVTSLIESGVDTVVTSPQFASVWETALRQAQSGAIAVIQQQEGTVVTLSDDGVVALDVGVIVAAIRTQLIANGLTIAANIPDVDRSIALVSSQELVTVRTAYTLATAAGTWLPWVCLALILAGIALARRRVATTARAGLGLALSIGVLGVAILIGRALFASAVSPSVMSADAANGIVDQLLSGLVPSLVALIVLGIMIGIAGWLSGTSSSARAVRRRGGRLLAACRATADARGLGTGRFGTAVQRGRVPILVVLCLAALVIVLLVRPLSLASVFVTLAVLVVAVLVVELVRRPTAE